MSDDRTIPFTVRGQPRTALLREPARPCRRPALLVYLTGNAQASLDKDVMRITPDIFLAAGHRVASFDLPCHGDPTRWGPTGLPGMAAAVAQGEDVFADIRETGRALLDALAERDLSGADVVVGGISRGGLAALHVMAGDERVAAAAVHAPVTFLPALKEFAVLRDNPIVARSNAAALVDRLTGRAVFLSIGRSDRRVGAEHCLEFYKALASQTRVACVELFRLPGDSHTAEYREDTACQVAAAFLLRACAERDRERSAAP